jgi:hypothetical protein
MPFKLKEVLRQKEEAMKKAGFFLILLVLLGPAPLFADGGSIPFNRRVQVFEPNQRNSPALNGYESFRSYPGLGGFAPAVRA